MSVLTPTQLDTTMPLPSRASSALYPFPPKILDNACFDTLLAKLPPPLALFRPSISRLELEYLLATTLFRFDRTSCQMDANQECEQRSYQEAPPNTTTFNAAYQRGICVRARAVLTRPCSQTATATYLHLRHSIANHLRFLKPIEPLLHPEDPLAPPQLISWNIKTQNHSLTLSLSLSTDHQIYCTLSTIG